MTGMRTITIVAAFLLEASCSNDAGVIRLPSWRIQMAGHEGVIMGSLHSTPVGMRQRLPDFPRGWPIYLEGVKSQEEAAGRDFVSNALKGPLTDGPLEVRARSVLKGQPGVAGLRTWALAYLVSSRHDKAQTLGDGPGTEALIDPEGIAAPLEDPGLVYGDLAGMPLTDQREYLRQALSGTASCRQDLASGSLDEEALAACGSRPLRYLTTFLGRRNERMCSSAASALRRGNAVIAVGAAHLFGPDSLIACLKAKGAQITNISRA